MPEVYLNTVLNGSQARLTRYLRLPDCYFFMRGRLWLEWWLRYIPIINIGLNSLHILNLKQVTYWFVDWIKTGIWVDNHFWFLYCVQVGSMNGYHSTTGHKTSQRLDFHYSRILYISKRRTLALFGAQSSICTVNRQHQWINLKQ